MPPKQTSPKMKGISETEKRIGNVNIISKQINPMIFIFFSLTLQFLNLISSLTFARSREIACMRLII